MVKLMSRNRVTYEWDIEEWRGKEILEHDFREKLSEYSSSAFDPREDGLTLKLVLVRYEYNDSDGVIDQAWAYVESGVLPEAFDDGAKVPKKLHAEYKRWIKKWNGGEA